MIFSYIKVPPTQYVLHFEQGRIRREGVGLSFWYYTPTESIAAVPAVSTDAPFVFTVATADFQTATVQGQLTYRVTDPRKVASLLDFSIQPNGAYTGDGPQKLQERLIQSAQVATRAFTQRLNLREVLTSAASMSVGVAEAVKATDTVANLGVEVLGLSILSLKTTPEMAKALEAEAREELQRKSDEAIYARRNAAVEQERRIKENELNTAIAVEEKQRLIRETQMAAEIAIEEQRATLMEQKVANERKESDSRAYALEVMVKALENIDWKKLMFASANKADAGQLIAMAFQEMAGNASKIGELNVSPELLAGLIGGKGR